MNNIANKNYDANFYKYSKDKLFDAIQLSLSNGGDYAELFFENTKSNNIQYLDKKVDSMNLGVLHGVGLRILHNMKTIYLYSNNTSIDNIMKLAKEASSIINDIKHIPQNFRDGQINDSHPLHIDPFGIPFSDKINLLKSLDEKSRAVSDKIKQVSARYIEKERQILICSSRGIYAKDNQTYTRLISQSLASDGKETQSAHNSYGALDGFEFIKNIDIDKMSQDTSDIAIRMLSAGYPKGGTYPVVIENSFGGVIFHEACGHALEATSVADNASVFTGKMGQKIANEVVTAVDDGTIVNEWGSYNIDDEGNAAQKTTLIENGILKNYLVDILGEMKMKDYSITGSSRRENYQYPPTSRMRNTYIDKGNHTMEDLTADIKYGLYAKKMGGGSVDPATTEFNFAVVEGYLIENGKITHPVRGATLIGKGDETLMKIEKISNNLELADGMCGSISGNVPTTVGQPAIMVSSMTVGGR